jgi:hypothetical protein
VRQCRPARNDRGSASGVNSIDEEKQLSNSTAHE